MRASFVLGAAAVLVVACAVNEDPSASQVEHATASGLLSLAPSVSFGTPVKGVVRGGQLDIWGIDLKGGDKLKLVEKVTSGNLKPDAQLFLGTSKVSSASFSSASGTLTKSYAIETTGRYYVAVRAYQNQGEGDYSLTLSCTGGPCNGEPVVVTLDDEQAGACVEKARWCAFKGLPPYEGEVGPATAKKLFDECLAAAVLTDEGLSCKTACDETERRAVCDGILGLLPFYADQSASCLGELNDCLEVCSQDDYPGLVQGSQDICLLQGFNGNCDSFARGHAECGGEYVDDSVEECHAWCESTFGAWNDDLDTICVEDCGELPE